MATEPRHDGASASTTPGLRRELRFWEALALSIGIMAPTLAMSLNGVAPAGLIGEKVPLAFLLAFLGIGLVAYGFVRLTRYFNHAGSVYGLAGATLGPRAGFVGGWALLGYYFVSTVATLAATGLFAITFLDSAGIATDAPWLPIALGTAALVWFLATREIKVAARSLLSIEGASVALIVILVVVILGKVLAGTAPGDKTFDLSVFVPDGDISFSAVMAATVFGFLSWAGFEATATLGEETDSPRRDIPRALMIAVGATGVLYLVTIFAQTIGFGASPAGAKAFANSGAPLSVLSDGYVGSWLATLLDFGATASAFASALGSATAGSRLLYAFSRDGWGPARLARVAGSSGAPRNAVNTVLGLAVVMTLIVYAAWTQEAVDIYFYVATMGVLALLLVYAMANLGALRFLFFAGAPKAPRWEIVVPLLAVVYIGYVLFKQFSPTPESPYNVLPFVAIAWTLFGAGMALLRPERARLVGETFSREIHDGAQPEAEAKEDLAPR